MNKLLQIKRQRILDCLTRNNLHLKHPTYKNVVKEVDGKFVKAREYQGDRVTVHPISDWIKAEKTVGGKAARLRLRYVLREVIKLAEEAKKKTFEIDKLVKERKENK